MDPVVLSEVQLPHQLIFYQRSYAFIFVKLPDKGSSGVLASLAWASSHISLLVLSSVSKLGVDLHAWLSLGGRSLGLILASLSLRNGVFGFMSGGCVSLVNHTPPTPSRETTRAGGMLRVESTTPCRIKAKKRHIFTFEKSGTLEIIDLAFEKCLANWNALSLANYVES